MNKKFWNNKNVILTGHTGFKGAWLCHILEIMGARVVGIGLPPTDRSSIFYGTHVSKILKNNEYKIPEFTDILNTDKLLTALQNFEPEIIIHFAAQPLVSEGYSDPFKTYNTNVMGTVNLLSAINRCPGNISAILSITTDKVYKNDEKQNLFVETDQLGGDDPYSASKACADIVSQSFYNSYFKNKNIALATARAGNVIGGGDWSENRLIPDIIRAYQTNGILKVRSPDATRPWQHVLEPLVGYLLLCEQLSKNKMDFSQPFNFGPNKSDCLSVYEVLKIAKKHLSGDFKYTIQKNEIFHEANYLQLDSAKAKKLLNWESKMNAKQALEKTINWYKTEPKNVLNKTYSQIEQYLENY